MVHQQVVIRDRYWLAKKWGRLLGVVAIMGVVLVSMFVLGFFSRSPTGHVVLAHPLEGIVFAHTNAEGVVNYDAVLGDSVAGFNADYLTYLLVSFGVSDYLHRSPLGGDIPRILFHIGSETWTSEIIGGTVHTIEGTPGNPDIIISLSKEEAVSLLLSSNTRDALYASVLEGRTRIEPVVHEVTLASKGYTALYTSLVK